MNCTVTLLPVYQSLQQIYQRESMRINAPLCCNALLPSKSKKSDKRNLKTIFKQDKVLKEEIILFFTRCLMYLKSTAITGRNAEHLLLGKTSKL